MRPIHSPGPGLVVSHTNITNGHMFPVGQLKKFFKFWKIFFEKMVKKIFFEKMVKEIHLFGQKGQQKGSENLQSTNDKKC